MYRLYILYRDTCWNQTIRVESSNALELYNEMKLTHVYETHWDEHHADIGDFPYSSDSPFFPSFEEFQQVMNSLTVGQIKYVMRSKIYICSYFCSLKRLV
jgi:hypothetical protein